MSRKKTKPVSKIITVTNPSPGTPWWVQYWQDAIRQDFGPRWLSSDPAAEGEDETATWIAARGKPLPVTPTYGRSHSAVLMEAMKALEDQWRKMELAPVIEGTTQTTPEEEKNLTATEILEPLAALAVGRWNRPHINLNPGAINCVQFANMPGSWRSLSPSPWTVRWGKSYDTEQMSALPHETFYGEILGKRAWTLRVLRDGSPRLECLGMHGHWPAGRVDGSSKMVLDGAADVMPFPDADHVFSVECHNDSRSGFWAVKPEFIDEVIGHYAHYVHVVGTVRLWGAVVEHEKGWRAECMEIIDLKAVDRRAEDYMPELRAFYMPAVDVVSKVVKQQYCEHQWVRFVASIHRAMYYPDAAPIERMSHHIKLRCQKCGVVKEEDHGHR